MPPETFYVDGELIGRWAGWLMSQGSNYGNKVAAGNRAKAQSLSKAAEIAWRSMSIETSTALAEEFSHEELLHIIGLTRAEMGTLAWSESAPRQRRRREALNKIAHDLGYDTWSRVETAVINGDVVLRLEQAPPGTRKYDS